MNEIRELETKDLTTVQLKFVDAWLKSGEDAKLTAKEMGWENFRQCHEYKRKPHVARFIAERKHTLAELLSKQAHMAGITPTMRVDLLWRIAQKGSDTMIDKDGNHLMVNAGAAVSAIREINLMTGAHAPVKTEAKVEVTKRDALEIRGSIAALQEEARALLSKMADDTDIIDIETE